MSDDTRAKPAKGTLPAFTPVPRLRKRHDNWTAERQREFIEALADLGCVQAAARRIGKSPDAAYLLRRHPQAGEFRKAWDAALTIAVRQLEDSALSRALHGVEEPVFHNGVQIGTRRKYNDRLVMFMLRNRAPKRFAADSMSHTDPSSRSQLLRLKKQWHKEWERERALRDTREDAEVCQSIDDFLDTMIRNTENNSRRLMSPHVRQLRDAYKAAEKEDREAGYPMAFADEDGDDDADGGAAEDTPDNATRTLPSIRVL